MLVCEVMLAKMDGSGIVHWSPHAEAVLPTELPLWQFGGFPGQFLPTSGSVSSSVGGLEGSL